MHPTWVLFSPLLEVLGLPWPRSLFLLVPVLLLGGPWLLGAWALLRLRAMGPARPTELNAESGLVTAPGGRLVRAYLLANYAAAVQLSTLREERALPVVSMLVMLEVGQFYTAFYTLLVWRSVSYVIGWALLALFALAVYQLVLPRIATWAQRYRTVSTHQALPPQHQSAWGLLGQALLWGSFTFIFICIILRAKYNSL